MDDPGLRVLRQSGTGTAFSGSLETNQMRIDDSPIFSQISHNLSHEALWEDTEHFRTQRSPLRNRAWVFQERLLSRTLHFGASELLGSVRPTALASAAVSATLTP